jgi:dihydrofolate reductase
MGRVIADITMSLDGFVTGPDAGPRNGLGDGGEPLHRWAVGDDVTDADREILRAGAARAGAVVMGRNTFDVVDGPDGWSEDVAYAAAERPEALPPVFVVTHDPPAQVRLRDLFRFVTGGPADAIARAREAAGDRDVVVMGGGDLVRQVVEAGLADQLVIHLAPILLGAGTSLWGDARIEMVQRDVVVTGAATHITYDTLSNAGGART